MRSFRLLAVFFLLSSCATREKNITKSTQHLDMALSLLKKCDNRRALSHLLKAIKLNPKDFIIRHTLADVYYSIGQYDRAGSEYKKILKSKPDLTEARVNLARVYINLNRIDESLKEIQRAEKDLTYPHYQKIVSQKSLAYYKKGQFQMAKKWLNEAFSLPHGKTCFNYLQGGKTELALGYLKESKNILKKALSVCANEKPFCGKPSSEGHFILARLYIKEGDKKRARYHLKLFLKRGNKELDKKKARELLNSLKPDRQGKRSGKTGSQKPEAKGD